MVGQGVHLEVLGSEEQLIGQVLLHIHQIDPDLIVAHDLFGAWMETLCARATHLRLPHLNHLGRLNRVRNEKEHKHSDSKIRYLTAGRLICDVYKSSREYLPGESDYSLVHLTKSILKESLVEMSQEEVEGRL